MRLLFVTRTYPYPAKAGDLKFNAGLLEALAEHVGTELHVFCGGGVPETPKHLRQVTWHGPQTTPGRAADLRGLLGSQPRAAERAMSVEARRHLRQLVTGERFDAVLLSESCVAPALSCVAGQGAALIYLSHNVDIDIRPNIARKVKNPVLRLIQTLDAWKYRRMEMNLLKRVDGITTITREDAMRYTELAPNLRCILLQPGYDGPTVTNPIAFDQTARLAVVIGSFEWNAKLHNLKTILNAYERHIARANGSPPGIRIAGRIGTDMLETLRKAHPAVDFSGEFGTLDEVTADARLALVLEDLGGGFKLKILDYVFSHLPIVGLPSAMTGVDFEPGKDFLSVSSADEAFDVVAQVVDDETLLRRMADSALEKAADQFDWCDRARDLVTFARQLKGDQEAF